MHKFKPGEAVLVKSIGHLTVPGILKGAGPFKAKFLGYNGSDGAAVDFGRDVGGHGFFDDGKFSEMVSGPHAGWFVSLTQLEPGDKDEVHIKAEELKTTAYIKGGGRGEAVCSANDDFDFPTGAAIALARAYGVEPKELAHRILRAVGEQTPDTNGVKEVKRQAKAGEYIKIVRPDYSFDSVGNVYRVSSTLGSLALVENRDLTEPRENVSDGYTWAYEQALYVVLEGYKPEQKRPKKLGLYGHGDFYGIPGTPTPYKDIHGSPLYVGDVVTITADDRSCGCETIVTEDAGYPFVMGIRMSCNAYYGDIRRWKVEWKKSWKELKAGDEVNSVEVREYKEEK